MIYKNIIYSLCFLFSNIILAQVSNSLGNDNIDIIYKQEFTMGLKAHTNGFGLSANFVKINNIHKKRVYEIEIMDIKHPKEFRQQSLFSQGRTTASKGFVYGKENNFFNINVSRGTIRTIAEKARKSGVSISMYYAGGVSLGLAKPYYLDLIDRDFSRGVNIVTKRTKFDGADQQTQSDFLDEQLIVGSSGFIHGFDELTPYPGVQGKVALLFDWATYNEFVKAIEIGGMVNAYLKRIPILVTDDNSLFFTNLYVKFTLGKRK